MPKPRILFVEDEDYIARVIKSSLEDAGYEVFRANSLAQGRVEAATRSPELLILDLGLPDGDGTDLIRTLRSYSSVPIIILSARSGDDAKVEALDLGADDYISKPFSMMELLARVRAHLRRAALCSRARMKFISPSSNLDCSAYSLPVEDAYSRTDSSSPMSGGLRM